MDTAPSLDNEFSQKDLKPEDLFTTYSKFGTESTVFNVSDATAITKYHFVIRRLDANNKTNKMVEAYADADLIKAWAAAYIAGTFEKHFPTGLKSFGGGYSKSQAKLMSRALGMAPGTKKPGLLIEIQNGEGVEGNEGQITPKKDSPSIRDWTMLKPEQAIVLATKILFHQVQKAKEREKRAN